MPILPLVPLPRRVAPTEAASPFPITSATTVSGDTDAAGTLAALLRTRTGLELAATDDGDIVLSVGGGGELWRRKNNIHDVETTIYWICNIFYTSLKIVCFF